MASLRTFLHSLFGRPVPAPDADFQPTTPVDPHEAFLLDPTEGSAQCVSLGDSLQVDVTSHSLGEVPCWTFVSRGLPVELSLTVRRDRSIDPTRWWGLLGALSQDPQAPALLVPYNTIDARHGLLGHGRFRCALLLRPLPLDVPGTATALTVLLLDDEEAAWRNKLGPTRIAARLGLQNSWFPTTPWADPERPSVVDQVAAESDPFNGMVTLFLGAATVTRTRDTSVVVQLPHTVVHLLEHLGLGEGPQVRLLTGSHPTARSTFVHRPDKPATAIAAVASSGHMALNGLVLSLEDHDALHFTDDYAALVMTPSTWAAWWRAVDSGGTVHLGTSTAFIVAPDSDVYLPDASKGVVRSIRFARPTSPASPQLDPDGLAAVVESVADVLESSDLRGAGRLQVHLGSKVASRFRFDGPIEAAPGAMEEALQRLRQLDTPTGTTGLRFDLDVDFNT